MVDLIRPATIEAAAEEIFGTEHSFITWSELVAAKTSWMRAMVAFTRQEAEAALRAGLREFTTARPLTAYHEDMGSVLWWTFPIIEPPYCGHPGDEDWPGYHSWFTPLPLAPTFPASAIEDAMEAAPGEVPNG